MTRHAGVAAALVWVLAAGLALACWQGGLLDRVDRAAVDARFSVRGSERPPSSIALVAIDENSLARLPRLPLPRRLYGQLIDRLHHDGARLIVVDIAFDTTSDRADDDALQAAARRAAPVLFGTTLIDGRGRTLVLGGPAAQRRIGARVASTLLPADPGDGTVRRQPGPVKGLAALGVAAARLGGAQPDAASSGRAAALIDYAGGAGTFPAVSLAAVLAGEVPRSRLAGKTVIVGATARALQDLHPTPFGQMAGVEIHANALATATRGDALVPVRDLVTVLLTLLLAAVTPAAAARLRLTAALGLGAGAAVALLAAAQVAFAHGHVLELGSPVLASLLAAGATLVTGYVGADRERRALRERFAAGSPEVVDAVLDPAGASALDPAGVIGGFRVQELAGHGGMAVVYRATQTRLDRSVALKLIAPGLARDPTFRARFLRESRAAAAVEHPNVIPVYEAGDDDGLLFIAMRYVDGLDLQTVLDRLGPLDPSPAVRVISQVAAALDAAHAKGLVHRDVKPANVLLDDALEHAYLTDFGIAQPAGPAAGGPALGTPAYAAPEVVAGGAIDARADVYALGVLAHRTLTGLLPPDGDAGAFSAAIARATDPDASARWPSAGAFAAAVRAVHV